MPRSGPRRPLVAVRMTAEEIKALDKIADDRTLATFDGQGLARVTRSDVVRDAVHAYLANQTKDET